MAKTKLKKDYLVVKLNSLNEMRTKEMSLQELRLFSIYLSKINPQNQNTRLVRFSLEDFRNIMDLRQLNVQYFQKIAYGLVRKTVSVPTERGGLSVFNVFRECTIEVDENGVWHIEIDADDKALPLLFDFRSHFFKYELWNTLRLKGKNQLRMYEILKQCEKIGHRVISIEDLKGMLGIKESEYPQFKEFRRCVLEVCKKALAENTDISFVYEPYSKKGRKVYELKFTINKNKDYKDPLKLDKFIDLDDNAFIENDYQEIDLDDIDENGNVRATGKHWKYEERITFLMDACDGEFSRKQMIVLFDNMPDSVKYDENTSHDYLQSKYREMDMRKPSKSRFGYLKKIISEVDV